MSPHRASHNAVIVIFVLQVPNILLPGSLELLAGAVSRYTEPRLADGLRAPPHLCHRLTQHCYLSLLLLLLPCSLQGHRGLRGKLKLVLHTPVCHAPRNILVKSKKRLMSIIA
jgi:hypothetical protein